MIWRAHHTYRFVYHIRNADEKIERRETEGILIQSYHDYHTFVIITNDNPKNRYESQLAMISVHEAQVTDYIGKPSAPWLISALPL